MKRYAVIDLETSGLNPRTDKVLSWAVCWGGESEEFGLAGEKDYRLWEIISDPNVILVGHNIKFDIQFLRKMFPHWSLADVTLRDTLLAAWLLNENEAGWNKKKKIKGAYTLGGLVKKYTGRVMKGFAEYGTQGKLFEVAEPIEVKCKQDVAATWELFNLQLTRLEGVQSIKKVYENLYCPLIKVIVEMEETGTFCDVKKVNELKCKFDLQKEEAKKRFCTLLGWPFPLNKNVKLSELFFGERRLKPKAFMVRDAPKYRMKGRPLWKVSYDILCEYRGEDVLINPLLDYRDAIKLSRTYCDTWLEAAAQGGGRMYSHFWQTGTDTGRWSSSQPINWQNVPKGVGLRESLVAPDGYCVLYADYSQLELRLMAHASGDLKMVEAYCTGQDLHEITRAYFGCDDRTIAKNANFSLIYGVGPRKFQRILAVAWPRPVLITEGESREFGQKFKKLYSGVDAYNLRVRRTVDARGYVETILCRRRRLDGLYRLDPERAYRTAVNATIQGSGADIIGLALVEFYKRKHVDTRLNLQVHDAVAGIVRVEHAEKEREVLRECMQKAITLKVPLIANCGIGATLGEAEKNAK